MTDPWDAFAAAAPGAEVAGYFERASGHAGPAGAVWFDRADELREVRASTDPVELARDSGSFLERNPRGGLVGYLGFEAFGLFEPLLRRAPGGSPFPLGEFAWVRTLPWKAVPPRSRRVRAAGSTRSRCVDSLPRNPYQRAVRRLVREIRDGEAFQVVLAHRRSFRRPADLLAPAGRLRRTERFSFFYYLKFGDRELVGATPESVAEVRGGAAVVNPIAGTLPRAPTPGRLPLGVDPKELAEHRMLVDLARNDLGRIARPGTVRLLWTERRVRYARLEHLVSRVGGRLRRGVGPWEVLAAAFPAGTVSGAPKIRATELLRQEEGSWRGPYAGTVAAISSRGRADFALAIRTGFAAGRRLHTAAGAGIVHLSDPAREFDETITKLSHLESTLLGDGR